MVAILVLATLVTRLRSQTGKSVSVSAQCALIFPFSFLNYLSIQNGFYTFPVCFSLSPDLSFLIILSNALCLQDWQLREITGDDLAIGVGKRKRYIRLRIYRLKGKRITRYAFPIAYWRRAMTRCFMYKWHTFLFFTTECIILSWGLIRAKRS